MRHRVGRGHVRDRPERVEKAHIARNRVEIGGVAVVVERDACRMADRDAVAVIEAEDECTEGGLTHPESNFGTDRLGFHGGSRRQGGRGSAMHSIGRDTGSPLPAIGPACESGEKSGLSRSWIGGGAALGGTAGRMTLDATGPPGPRCQDGPSLASIVPPGPTSPANDHPHDRDARPAVHCPVLGAGYRSSGRGRAMGPRCRIDVILPAGPPVEGRATPTVRGRGPEAVDTMQPGQAEDDEPDGGRTSFLFGVGPPDLEPGGAHRAAGASPIGGRLRGPGGRRRGGVWRGVRVPAADSGRGLPRPLSGHPDRHGGDGDGLAGPAPDARRRRALKLIDRGHRRSTPRSTRDSAARPG